MERNDLMTKAVPAAGKPTTVDTALSILDKRGTPMHWRDLVDAIMAVRMPADTVTDLAKARSGIYTEINLDNRFTYVGDGLWGLREWAPKQAARSVPLTTALRGRREKVQREEETLATDDDDDDSRSDDSDSTRHDDETTDDEWEEPEERCR
jgi:DNA-directed RNA polymerase subunit delta